MRRWSWEDIGVFGMTSNWLDMMSWKLTHNVREETVKRVVIKMEERLKEQLMVTKNEVAEGREDEEYFCEVMRSNTIIMEIAYT